MVHLDLKGLVYDDRMSSHDLIVLGMELIGID